MKAWWTETGWPWLKENWWVMLILPVMLLVWIAMRAKPGTTIIDPLKNADARAKEEGEHREKMLEEENLRLEEELLDIKEKHDTLQKGFEEKLEEEVESLKRDPEKLRELMLRTGRGGQ